MATRSTRVETMGVQLEQVAGEYLAARQQFEEARIAFEVARQKFTSVRRLAATVLSDGEWYEWRVTHPTVRYTGLKLGEALELVLTNNAYTHAAGYWRGVAVGGPAAVSYTPGMSRGRIQGELERGGFEFRSSAPLREVNAGLINASGVKKDGNGVYKSARADEILKEMEFIREQEERKLSEVKSLAAQITIGQANPQNNFDDDVPF